MTKSWALMEQTSAFHKDCMALLLANFSIVVKTHDSTRSRKLRTFRSLLIKSVDYFRNKLVIIVPICAFFNICSTFNLLLDFHILFHLRLNLLSDLFLFTNFNVLFSLLFSSLISSRYILFPILIFCLLLKRFLVIRFQSRMIAVEIIFHII